MAVFRVYGRSMDVCVARAQKILRKSEDDRDAKVADLANTLFFSGKPVALKSFETLAGCEFFIEFLKSKNGFDDLRIYAHYPAIDKTGKQRLTKKKVPIFRWLPFVKDMDHC